MLRIFEILFGLLCLAKALDVGVRGGSEMDASTAAVIGFVWAAAAVLIIVGRFVRIASAAVIVAALALTFASNFHLFSQHLYVFIAIGVILLLNQSVVFLLKVQLSIAYGFAALSKLNEAFLSGTVIYDSAVHRPFWEHLIVFDPTSALLIPLSIAAVCTEAFLAIGFWFRATRWVALTIGLGFHTVMLVLMAATPWSLWRLSIFGFLMVLLYAPFFSDELDKLYSRITRRTVATPMANAR